MKRRKPICNFCEDCDESIKVAAGDLIERHLTKGNVFGVLMTWKSAMIMMRSTAMTPMMTCSATISESLKSAAMSNHLMSLMTMMMPAGHNLSWQPMRNSQISTCLGGHQQRRSSWRGRTRRTRTVHWRMPWTWRRGPRIRWWRLSTHTISTTERS